MATPILNTSARKNDDPKSILNLIQEIERKGGDRNAGECRPARAFAWARVSTAEQNERGLSIPEQLREVREYAEANNIEIVAEFAEAASAYQHAAKRTEFDRMIKRAKAEQVPMILVHDFSRFSRDSVGAKALVRELRGAGIKVVSLNDPEIDPETVAGVYMEAITFAKNEAYSREVAFHTRKGCRANVQTRDPETGWCYKNGGQPPWGYRSLQLQRGQEKPGRPIIKSVWVLDDTIVAGRPAHQWVRHCLIELAAAGASLAELRDFCNGSGIPARRKKFWGISTWNAILQPSVIAQFCGYGVWNARTKQGRERPASEWVIVPNAHPAIISEEEARGILSARRQSQTTASIRVNRGRSLTSEYLLSGGIFRCDRCGANMIGFRTSSGEYYVCGSQPYRRGFGCGPGVYVPRRAVEAEVCQGISKLLGACADPEGLTSQVNTELRRMWEAQRNNKSGEDASKEIDRIDQKISNIRCAIENGLADAHWANTRLRDLAAERKSLIETLNAAGPPQINMQTVAVYQRQTAKLMEFGQPAERKRLLRAWVEQISLEPEKLDVKISYRLPEVVMKGMVAGAGFEPATFGL